MKLLNYAEAAQLLTIPVGTLYVWTQECRVPHLRFGTRTVRFDEDELVKWMRDRSVALYDETKARGAHG